MINFIEGKINLGEKSISPMSNYEDLSSLAKEGLIEKREDAGGMYYYVEAEADGMRFGVFISLRDKRIEWLLLRWLDRPMKSWDDVSEKAMTDEYHVLSNFVKKQVGAPPNNIKTGTRTWRFKWGQINLSYEVRSFDVAIFMKPR
jgi:DNA-binding transcriptional ArsR family regulator